MTMHRPYSQPLKPKPDPDGGGKKRARRRKLGTTAGADLRDLDHQKVAVHLVIKGRERVVRGLGTYGLDARLGGVLRIHCADDSGNFEILIREKAWKGEIKSGAAFGCDYVVALALPGSQPTGRQSQSTTASAE
jgi:hypothetical protein